MRHVEFRVVDAAPANVDAEQLHLPCFRHIDARVLQQRREIVGSRAGYGVLKIEDAQAGDAAALRHPQKIR